MAHHQALIVGGGAAGLTVAARLKRLRPELDVAILEPSPDHYYQPGWTLVGGGVFSLQQTHRPEAELIPEGVRWIRAAAEGFDPAANTVGTSSGETLSYETLVVATGIKLCWDRIKGLPQALGSQGITSNYSREHLNYTWQTIQGFKGGQALFTFPDTPIKCAGAPQKIMYLADDVFKRSPAVAACTRVIYATATPGIFAIPAFAAPLRQVVARRGIDARYLHTLREVRAESKEAVFSVKEGESEREEVISFEMLHVTPPMTAPDVVATSPLAVAGPGGWVDVDKGTTQHVRYPNVFSIGDVSSLPNSKTAAAVRGQAPVLVDNLLAHLDSRPLLARYDGYACCPLITGYGKVIMAEFNYEGQPTPSFPLDPTVERSSMWQVKTRLLPWLYWNRMLKGYDHERRFMPGIAKPEVRSR
ncbi:MAG: FAD/NAD(P)-binding oxidoreductase [Prochlorococcaceae cyanobacterium]